MQKIVIVGAGQNGYVIKNILSLNKDNHIIGFLEDRPGDNNEVLGPVSEFKKYLDCKFFVSVGNNKWRKEYYKLLKEGGANFTNAIHPSAIIENGVSLGVNIMIGALTYINIGSVIKNNCLINNGVIIEHDNKVGDHCNINPGVVTGGGVIIEDDVFVGLGAKIRDHISIGKNSTIGMGSVVLKDVPSNTLYYNKLVKIEEPNI